MFGTYDYTFQFENEVILAKIEKKNGFFQYTRICNGSKEEKILASDSGRIIVNPVEPINLPEEVGRHLMIEFDPIVVEPHTSKKIYLTFPIEIGVFVEAKREIEVLDIFSAVDQKYTLYGSPDGGVIARWHPSGVFAEIPKTYPLKEGVLELGIRNTCRDWVEVSRVVFESVDMKIYYGNIVGMVAVMKILNKHTAEMDFLDQPLMDGMKKSIELYTARKIPAIQKGYLMEWGLN
ncbi:MAG: DUF432 domain-containing protein [Methanomicrobiaceae archaeon]|uniref:DUF432 domain-containing protein n=1 Tax=hydrocarbon metagenome TaxID=938273 RepID=A0A0W8FJG8_9ZZZZ|nr:DUF432 domain-containing protein [Methanomicrobiaceae archaeon]MDD5418377.1 DUF432 domain-containing protein [Methanomicrobiaceae archaeon]